MKKIIILCSIISALFFVSCDLTGVKITQQFVPETPSETEETTETETPSETTEIEETEEEPELVPYITIYNPLDVEVHFAIEKEVTGKFANTQQGLKLFIDEKNRKENDITSISGVISPGETYSIYSRPSENYFYVFDSYYFDDNDIPIYKYNEVLLYSSIELKLVQGQDEEKVISAEFKGSRLY